MTRLDLITLDSVSSTNRYLAMATADRVARGVEIHGLMVAARTQTAGRGQRGNSWEAEPGMNITASIALVPHTIAARDQFYITEIVALAIVGLLDPLLPDGMEAEIKWPNDIYVGDRKICGVLIENTLTGTRIGSSIAGIGININQRRFLSDAPNPISLVGLTGREYSVDDLTRRLGEGILDLFSRYDNPDSYARLHALYLSRLWRREGYHPYIDAATGSRFEGQLTAVAPDGMLTLTDTLGHSRRYAFKEVAAVVSES